MKNIIKENKQFLFAFFGTLLLILSGSIFVSNSNVQVDELVIKSITPIYEEDSGVKVSEEDGIIFNDKNQEVKYKILVENVLDYDVKFNHVELSNPSEDFLEYEVVGIDTNDVIKTGETREIEVVLNTVSKEGWGRNFNDLLYARVVFDKLNQVIDEGTGNVGHNNKPVNNNSGVVDNGSNVETVIPNNNVTNKDEVVESSKTEVEEETEKDDVTHEMMTPSDVSTSDGSIKFYVFILGASCGVAGVGFILLSKNKLSKYIMFVIVLGTPLLIKADTIAHLPITLKVGFESQNIMKPSECHEESIDVYCDNDYWVYNSNIKNIYIQNEISEIKEYQYRFDVSNEQNNRVIATLVVNKDDSEKYDLYLQADGIIYPNENMSYYFANMTLDTLDNFEGLDTSDVINMNNLFKVSTLDFNSLNLPNLNVSNVTNMSGMFHIAKNNGEGTVNLDLHNWDVSKVQYFNGMFAGFSAPNNVIELNLENWNFAGATDLRSMFSNFARDASIINMNLKNWQTSSVTEMSYMFAGAAESSESVSLDVSGWDTSNVLHMDYMFNLVGSNSKKVVLNMGDWDTSKVTSMRQMFLNVGKLDETFTLDVSGLDTGNVTDMCNMFNGTGSGSKIFTLDVSNFDTSKVTDMSGMFLGVGKSSPIFTLDVSGFDMSKVVYTSTMFIEAGASSDKFITSITLSNPNLTSYSNMFTQTAITAGAQVTVNYTNDTSHIIDQIIATKTGVSNVVKGKLIVEVDKLDVGDEVYIEDEWFNVVGQDDDFVTLLAKYNLSEEYKQSETQLGVVFSNEKGWEYTPGPKEIDIQQFDGNARLYVNEYVAYLKGVLGTENIAGNLITVNELKDLGCTIYENYTYASSRTCANSEYSSWLVNGQYWWTRSALSDDSSAIILIKNNGALNYSYYTVARPIRPVVTVSKDVLKKYYDNKNVR